MAISVLAVHERIGSWGRQLRSRLSDRSVRIVETRSAEDLERAIRGAVSPLVVIDLGQRIRSGLADLQRALSVAPDALTLVIDPNSQKDVMTFARELGATQVLSGPVTPIQVLDVMTRWLSLAQERVKLSELSLSESEPSGTDPLGWLESHIQRVSAGQRATGD